MKRIPELLIVAGTGRNSGKTTLVCKLIKSFAEAGIYGVKISPHPHDLTEGSQQFASGKGYSIYRELALSGTKDTSRMLNAGAKESFYIFASDQNIEEAFNIFLELKSDGYPIICESPVLRRFFIPGLFLIADSNMVSKRKDLTQLMPSSDLLVTLGEEDDQFARILFGPSGWVLT